MRRLIVMLLQFHIFTFFLLYVPVSFAGMSQAFEEGINGDLATAKKSFNDLAAVKEKELQNVDFQIALRNMAAVGFYRVLEQVASDTLEKKISVNAAKQLMKAGKAASVGQVENAIIFTSSTLQNLRNYPAAHFLLGRFYLSNCLGHGKNCENYLKEYQTALKYDSELIYAYMDMGMAYGNKQKPYEAIKVYEKASSLASNDGVEGIVQLNLTFQYAMLKRWSQANEHMKKTIALKVTVPEDIVATIKQNL